MRLAIEKCVAVIVDIQERLLPHMFGETELRKNLKILIEGLRLLKVPLILTEQYPKGLGSTVPEFREILPEVPTIQKISFSCCDEPEFVRQLAESERKNVILAGIESHVCVMQTAIDLKANGYLPVVVHDCVSSRHRSDMDVAMERIRIEGITPATAESLLFEMCRQAGNDTFRAISRLVR